MIRDKVYYSHASSCLKICGVDYIRSTQNGSDSLMIISIAIAENIVGAGVTLVRVAEV